jgi:hypothetical protein
LFNKRERAVRVFYDTSKRGSMLLVFSCLISLSLAGQTGVQEATIKVYPVDSGEKVRLFTDRSLYCVNEQIRFTAEYSCIEELISLPWSTVLYVELIRWNGARIAGAKLKLTDQAISAGMEIPGNLPSGNYYLRAYTRWMRNYPQGEYACIGIKIVNPYMSETDDGPEESEKPPGINSLNFAQGRLINGISCVTDNREYQPGERVEVQVEIDTKNLAEYDRFYLSVARAGTVDTTDKYIGVAPGLAGDSPAYIEYLPEIRGITVSGKVTDKNSGLPLKEVAVSLSETQSGEYFASYTTDERGRFVFSLPDMMKQRDFFVQAETPSVINIDNDYCNRPIRLPYIAFEMNRDEMDYAREVMINQQLTERFNRDQDIRRDTSPEKFSPMVFYGSRKKVYQIDKYIELPDIKEFIFEIILEANIVNDKDKNSLVSMRRSVSGYFPPLILMDNIRVEGGEQLLKIPLSKIERVEVINADYMVGSTRYYGIMSFYSGNQDFAGLELNRNSLFFSYGLFSEELPDSDFSNRRQDQRAPDRRNLLYWNPDIRLAASGKTTVSLFTSDCTGEYVVFIRSKNHTDKGGIYGKCQFTVR